MLYVTNRFLLADSNTLYRMFTRCIILHSTFSVLVVPMSVLIRRCLRTRVNPFLSFPPHLLLQLSKSRQHLASSILGEIQADILSRTITVTFDHRMTGEWLTLRHQSMNFSLSARYNLQSASAFSLNIRLLVHLHPPNHPCALPLVSAA